MLAKEDYIRYLEQMAAIEAKMSGVYKSLENRADNKRLKSLFRRLSAEESGHRQKVKEVVEAIMKQVS